MPLQSRGEPFDLKIFASQVVDAGCRRRSCRRESVGRIPYMQERPVLFPADDGDFAVDRSSKRHRVDDEVKTRPREKIT